MVPFEGMTVDELEIAFKFMVEEHIKDCISEGKPVSKSYKGSFNVRISPDLHKKSAQFASIEGITLNQLVQRSIQHELEIDD